jgi:hypothetical protein
MGFFDGLGRMMAGKPVFEDTSSHKPPEQPIEPEPVKKSGLRDEKGYKIFPEFSIKNLKSRRSGDQITVTAWITNTCEQRIRIDTVHLLTKRQISQELNPNQSRELLLYQGPIPSNDHEHEAQIIYRLQENGDVFQDDYIIEYNRESDGKYTVEELHEEGETRDI